MATIPSKQQHQIGTEAELKAYLSSREIGILEDDGVSKLAFKDDDGNFYVVGGSGSTQVQSDWGENDSSKPSFIRNKPSIPQISIRVIED